MQPGSNHVARIEVQSAQLVIELTNAKSIGSKRSRSRNMLKVSWHKTPLRRRREILVPGSVPPQDARAIRSENRALLVTSIARGRRWLDELITDPTAKAESIATRDGCSVRKVNVTISLAFLAPDLVKAAIDGRLPPGMGVVRLADLPAEWSRQHQMLTRTGVSRATTPTGRLCSGSSMTRAPATRRWSYGQRGLCLSQRPRRQFASRTSP
jgi:site-specific DNA recombinase